MKYRFVASLASDIAELMTQYLKNGVAARLNLDPKSLLVTPVPLHFKRLNWRGFNQAEIIARQLSNYFDWDFAANTLKRAKNKKPQADMPDRYSRIKNVQNIFKFNPAHQHGKSIDGPLTDKTVVLVDDISTTGSTLNDCARALKGAGAKEVIGFVFARNKI
ncbi:MAG: ComF family protein [Candidatus Yanofskybacteria bacterium]|nr:ComF family protein [Candidatus Yanofskybacteria bacterium]